MNTDKSTNDLYSLWLTKAEDKEVLEELNSCKGDDDAIRDRFFRYLEFGTGGLRGVIGAGTNRMNIYTIGMTAQALADYLISEGAEKSVAIAHDSRIKSDVFARYAACVLASNGIKVHLYAELAPTPMLSYAVRELKCGAGIVITASHNPAEYNGFKCYGSDGCQMTDHNANRVYSFMQKLDIFDDVKTGDFDSLIDSGAISYIDESVWESYYEKVVSCSVNPDVFEKADLSVLYTPLCGAGNKPVRAVLAKAGVKNISVVKAQEQPDGTFPGCPFPNPEIREAFAYSLELAKTLCPELLLATDPDGDRVGIAVRKDGDYVLMSGNEVGAMMMEYLLSKRKENGTLPANPVVIKTIVTSDIGLKIAQFYKAEIRNLLTGFKYIGEQIGLLEAAGEENRFVMGYEESYGYLAGTYARDKDAVVASMIICEMASYYKLQGKSLLEVMDGIYEKYGYFCHRTCDFVFKGESGMNKMAEIMESLRQNPPAEIAGHRVAIRRDYESGEELLIDSGAVNKITLPQSNVLSYIFENGGSFIARPSGTEPKIKFYLTANAKNHEEGEAVLDALAAEAKKIAE
ncbi:MAG: phospho-sugar mutase [Oscillospiraceae bacterium]|jgi:phosphoglucomutase|nr:phospho-sugar mutase [Oscillospiraceae bacterium]